ncbi:hypothetical protein H9P43_009673 [Blastocladiella emersonii ATCC 22665]|nr:hypothetical protein H9P43_009673 [Blastocladiella emersonii ATCC 22665]
MMFGQRSSTRPAVQLFTEDEVKAPLSGKAARAAAKASRAASKAAKPASARSRKATASPAPATADGPTPTTTRASAAALAVADDDNLLVATSQVSRFHEATLETELRDVILEGVTVSMAGRELVSDARLVLRTGRRYVLCGMNGTGKSCLLRSIASLRMTGFPANVRVVMVDQHAADSVGTDGTPYSVLLAADTVYNQLKADVTALEHALLDDGTPAAAVAAAYAIWVRRATERLVEARRIADHRSGARGAVARTDLIAAENQLDALVDAVASLDPSAAGDVKLPTVADAHQLLEECYEHLEQYNDDEREARAKSILSGLGFTDQTMHQTLASLSGGWRMRAGLARALFLDSHDITVFDEPTNNLCLPSKLWLQEYIQTLSQTVVVISHDRDFIEAVGEELIWLKDKQLTYFDGTLSAYEAASREMRTNLERQALNIEKNRARLQAQITRNVRIAKATGNDKALNQAASKAKRIDRLGMEKTLDGKKFKVSNRAGYFFDVRPAVQLEVPDPRVVFKFPTPAARRSTGGPGGAMLMQLDNVSVKFRGAAAPALAGVTLSLAPRSRIALVGRNGQGKTVCASVIAGTLPVSSGTVTTAPGVRVGFMAQHLLDDVPESATPAALVAEWQRAAGIPATDPHAHLGAFGLGSLGHVPVAQLSGGQRAKLTLARACVANPHVIVCDEGTNHQDMASIVALTRAIRNFEGAVVIVSHDVWFVQRVIEGGAIGDEDVGGGEDGEDAAEAEVQRVNREYEAKRLDGTHQLLYVSQGRVERVEAMAEVVQRLRRERIGSEGAKEKKGKKAPARG